MIIVKYMDHLKKLGSKLLRLAVMTVAVLAYIVLLFLPVFFTQNAWVAGIWIGVVLLGTMYGAILHAIAKEKDKALPYLERLKVSAPETTKKFFLGIGIFVGLLIVGSILNNDEEEYVAPTTYTAPTYTPPAYVPIRSPSEPIHYDSDYKYNYRTGYSGDYGYNYDIEGYSDSGDYFYGEVDTEGKYGEGYNYDDYGNEIYVETEWTGNGELEAYDEDGNYYEFEVD